MKLIQNCGVSGATVEVEATSHWITPKCTAEHTEMVVSCAGCEQPIMDRFLMNVLDRAWHPGCVTCTDCKCALTEKCFSRNSKLYCKNDFFRQFGTQCNGCQSGISPNELVRKARDKVYHMKCFICMVCRKQLLTGEELYVVNDNKFLCKADYMNSKHKEGSTSDVEEMEDSAFENENIEGASDPGENSDKEASFDGDLITSPHTEDMCKEGNSPDHEIQRLDSLDNSITNNNNNSTSNSDKEDCDAGSVNDDANGNKRRGPRTTIKAKQLETLKAAFAATPKPTRHIREQLAAETGLNMRVIQVWFQNRRSKERRLKQMNSMGARRHFFNRNPRRVRGSHLEDSPEMAPPYGFYQPDGQPPEGFYGNNGGIYPSYPQEYYGQLNQTPNDNAFMQTNAPPPMDLQPPIHQGMHDNGAYITDMMAQTSPDTSLIPSLQQTPMTDNGYPRSSSYNPMSHHPPPIESW